MFPKELERLHAVNRFLKLKISKEEEIQEIVELAAKICQAPIALITLLGRDTQYIQFRVGLELETTTRRDSFCNHTIEQNDVLVVPDTLQDERFANSTLVTGDHHVRFYAGSPLTTQDGHNLGALCVLDQIPRQLTENQAQVLQLLSRQVINILEFDASLRLLKEQIMEAKKSENRLRSFFESFNSCYLLIGTNLEILDYNKALSDFVERVYGVRISIGMQVTDYIHKPLSEFMTHYNKALHGITMQAERRIFYKHEAIWWNMTYAPARNPEGDIIGVSFKATDTSERIANSQTVLAQNELLSQIAFIQSHELRKPVASILGLINIFKEEDYHATKEELLLMEKVAIELDRQIRLAITYTE